MQVNGQYNRTNLFMGGMMENLKIKVNDEAESKESQELLFELGCYISYPKKCLEDAIVLFSESCGLLTYSSTETYTSDGVNYKEITLPQLRDLVVLKRNDVGDATHYTKGNLGSCLFKNYVGEKTYAWHKKLWQEQPTAPYLLHPISDLKPIEKPMKEYLIPNDGNYKYQKAYPITAWKNWIEIPEGAEVAVYYKYSDKVFFWKENGKSHWGESSRLDLNWHDCATNMFTGLDEFLDAWSDQAAVIWQRTTKPEELPFIDDKPSLNEQYAEIERVRKSDKVLEEILEGDLPEFNFTPSSSAWDNQVGGDHYKQMVIQPMEFALKNKLDYAQSNVVKYVTRHASKNGKQDLLKAIHNIELMIEHYYGE